MCIIHIIAGIRVVISYKTGRQCEARSLCKTRDRITARGSGDNRHRRSGLTPRDNIAFGARKFQAEQNSAVSGCSLMVLGAVLVHLSAGRVPNAAKRTIRISRRTKRLPGLKRRLATGLERASPDRRCCGICLQAPVDDRPDFCCRDTVMAFGQLSRTLFPRLHPAVIQHWLGFSKDCHLPGDLGCQEQRSSQQGIVGRGKLARRRRKYWRAIVGHVEHAARQHQPVESERIPLTQGKVMPRPGRILVVVDAALKP